MLKLDDRMYGKTQFCHISVGKHPENISISENLYQIILHHPKLSYRELFYAKTD